MNDPTSLGIEFITRGAMPRASSWNNMARILRRSEWGDGLILTDSVKGFPRRKSKFYNMRHELTAGDVDAYEVVAITGSETTSGKANLILKTSAFEPSGSAEYDCIINGTRPLGGAGESTLGWGAYGDFPIIAKLNAAPVMNRHCGPKYGQKTLMLGESGFRIIGLSPSWGSADNLAWVVREYGASIGYGKLKTDEGSSLFTVDQVGFHSGLNVADTNGEISGVYNTYGDTFEVGLHCNFFWAPENRRFEIGDIQCPSPS